MIVYEALLSLLVRLSKKKATDRFQKDSFADKGILGAEERKIKLKLIRKAIDSDRSTYKIEV